MVSPLQAVKAALFSVLIVSGFLAQAVGASEAPARIWTPRQFHAAADGHTFDTKAVQDAIDAASAAGGGTVKVEKGTYLIGTIDLKSGVTLDLEAGSVLLGSPRIADYRRGNWPALVKAKGQDHIAIIGSGVINGQGRQVAADTVRINKEGTYLEFFPDLKPGYTLPVGDGNGATSRIDPLTLQKEGRLGAVVFRQKPENHMSRAEEYVRPQILELWDCKDVRVSGITLQDSACWVETYRDCENLTIEGIKVRSTSYWNNDGIDIVDCRKVRIEGCDIDADDDGICLKSEGADRACEDVSITHCRIRSSASALKLGTASRGAFRGIHASDLTIYDTYRSAVALESVDGAILEDVTVDRVNATRTGNAFFLKIGHRAADRPVGVVRNVVLSNFRVEIPSDKPDRGYETEGPPLKTPVNPLPASIVGLPGHRIENVTLRNIEIVYPGGGRREVADVPVSALDRIPEKAAQYPEFSMFGELPAWGLYVRHAAGIHVENMTLRLQKSDFRPAVVADDVHGISLDLTGVDSSAIVLHRVDAEKLTSGDPAH